MVINRFLLNKLFEDENKLLRVGGRFGNYSDSYELNYPILLQSDSQFTYLTVLKSHKKVKHAGVARNDIRVTYWVCRGRQVVKRYLAKCVVCKINQGKTFLGPESSSLPSYRLAVEFAFETTGLDFAGPLYVKDIYSKTSSNSNKCYILLFTCSTTRNVHLELTPSMHDVSVIRAIKRFLARRGIIKSIYEGLRRPRWSQFASEIYKVAPKVYGTCTADTWSFHLFVLFQLLLRLYI